MLIDFDAIGRLLGPYVAERFAMVCEDHLTDGLAAPALLAMAVERAAARDTSVAETMTDLLDAISHDGLIAA